MRKKNIIIQKLVKKIESITNNKKNDDEIYKFFKNKNLLDVFGEYKKKSLDKASSKKGPFIQKEPYKPILRDLYNLYLCVRKNKRITVLEFGSGYSTLIIALALEDNKKNFKDKINFRKRNRYEIFVVDNEKKFLNITKKRCDDFFKKNNIDIKIHYIFSECEMTTHLNRPCSVFRKLPNVNPDFIYLDGPDQFNIKGNSNGLNLGIKDFHPLSVDIMFYEYFLIPGTIIMSDGRITNCRFLENNFQRNWISKYDKKNDQFYFLLDEKSIGKSNDKQLNFYR